MMRISDLVKLISGKIKSRVSFFAILAFLSLFLAAAKAQDPIEPTSNLALCEEETLKIRILCDPEWALTKQQGGIMFFIKGRPFGSPLARGHVAKPRHGQVQHQATGMPVASDAVKKQEAEQVTVQISKSYESGVFFEDLTPSSLQNVYGYADNFKYSHLSIDGQPAVCVSGHPMTQPESQLIDYFVLKDLNLYRISFSVTPLTDFSKYESLFEEMILSFAFIAEPAPQ